MPLKHSDNSNLIMALNIKNPFITTTRYNRLLTLPNTRSFVLQPWFKINGCQHCRVPDTEWSFQDGGLYMYIVKKVGVKILTNIVLYRLS